MITITLLMEKGGVGKTTLATTIAAGLAIQGKRVLVVDADGQGHSTIIMGAKPQPGLYNMLVRSMEWQDVLLVVKPERYSPDGQGVMALLPGNHETMFIPMAINDPFLLQQRLTELSTVFDAVVIDTSPTPSLLNASILMATDYVLVPSSMEFLSMHSLRSSLKTIQSFSDQRTARDLSPVTTIGIVPTQYKANTIEHSENLGQVKQKYGDLVWAPINDRIIWSAASLRQQPIFTFAKTGKAVNEAWGLVNHVTEVCYA